MCLLMTEVNEEYLFSVCFIRIRLKQRWTYIKVIFVAALHNCSSVKILIILLILFSDTPWVFFRIHCADPCSI